MLLNCENISFTLTSANVIMVFNNEFISVQINGFFMTIVLYICNKELLEHDIGKFQNAKHLKSFRLTILYTYFTLQLISVLNDITFSLSIL
jgi:hypothetical protein